MVFKQMNSICKQKIKSS